MRASPPRTRRIDATLPKGRRSRRAPAILTGDRSNVRFGPDFTVNVATGRVSRTFENTQRGKIIVKSGHGSTQTFDFTASYDADGFSLKDGESKAARPGELLGQRDRAAGGHLTSDTCDAAPAQAPSASGPARPSPARSTTARTARSSSSSNRPTARRRRSTSQATTPRASRSTTASRTAVVPGTYSVSETVPAGWDLTRQPATTAPSPGPSASGPGETVTCTFNNRQDGKIIVVKQTDPDGSTQSFEFTAELRAQLRSHDPATNDSGNTRPRDVLGAEVNLPTAGTTSPAQRRATATARPATSTRRPARPSPARSPTAKTARSSSSSNQPGRLDQSFEFTASYDATLLAHRRPVQRLRQPRPRQLLGLRGTARAGWDLTSATPRRRHHPNSPRPRGRRDRHLHIQQPPGGKINVVKQTNPDGSTQSFDFTELRAHGFSLNDGQSNDSGNLDPGNYSVAERHHPERLISKSARDDGSNPKSIGLEAGETVTCTFTNRQRGKAKVIKTVRASPSGGQAFTFQLRQGASTTNNGTTLETLVANAGERRRDRVHHAARPRRHVPAVRDRDAGLADVPRGLRPGQLHATGRRGSEPERGQQHPVRELHGGRGRDEDVHRRQHAAAGRAALTIGFWKNWSSHSGGKQKPVLDQTLASSRSPGPNDARRAHRRPGTSSTSPGGGGS